MNTDSAFVIGKTHKVCQDYTSHGQEIYLSDGCSSSPDTDFGARLLIQSAKMFSVRQEDYGYNTIEHAAFMRDIVHLPADSLDATLLTAGIYDNMFSARCYGDGVIALKEKGSTFITAFSVEYAGNAPEYLSYLLSHTRKVIWDIFKPQNTRSVTCHWIHPNNPSLNYSNTYNDPTFTNHLELSGAVSDYEWVALMSDGVHSFTDSGTPVPIMEVLPLLLDFKNLNGEFVQRRMARFQKDIAAKGLVHNDDLSLAVINLGE